MSQKSRDKLKGLFKTGAKPSEQDFADFIESTLNIKDDGIEKPSGADTPLKITAQGDDEKLLEFLDKNGRNSWSISQKSGDKQGLNISNSGGSKLFIDSSSGNVGIGTRTPGAKLEVQGDLKLKEGVAVNNISSNGNLTGNSDLTIPTEKAIKTYVDNKVVKGEVVLPRLEEDRGLVNPTIKEEIWEDTQKKLEKEIIQSLKASILNGEDILGLQVRKGMRIRYEEDQIQENGKNKKIEMTMEITLTVFGSEIITDEVNVEGKQKTYFARYPYHNTGTTKLVIFGLTV